MREPPHDETPEERVRRERRGMPTGERIARLEERADADDGDKRQLRRTIERLEARVWILATGGSLLGAGAGATLATWMGGG